MTLPEWSYTAIVVAAVGYLVAFGLHALEWSSARGLAAVRPDDGSEDRQRVRVDLWGRLAVAATLVSAVVHVSGVVLRGVAAERPPWGNMYEFITSALAFAAIIYLVGVARFGMRWLGLGVTLLHLLFYAGDGLVLGVVGAAVQALGGGLGAVLASLVVAQSAVLVAMVALLGWAFGSMDVAEDAPP